MFLYPWDPEGRAWLEAGDDHWGDRAGDEAPAEDDRPAS